MQLWGDDEREQVMRGSRLVSGWLCAFWLALSSASAQAQITVDEAGDELLPAGTTIREAIQDANDGGGNVIDFSPMFPESTIELLGVNGPLEPIIRSLVIDGTNIDPVAGVTIDGSEVSGDFFAVESGETELLRTNITGGSVRVDSAGTLVMRNEDNYVSVIGLSGDGDLVKRGIGAWTIDGMDTRTGSTTVRFGRLIGEVNTAIHDDVSVEVEGTLELMVPSNATYDGVVSGAGDLVKSGSGRLEFNDTQTYSGGTEISEGTLSSRNLPLDGDFLIDGTLEIDDALDTTISGDISGTGTIGKSGAGTLIVSGSNSFSGTTMLMDGDLQGPGGSIPGDVDMLGTGQAIIFTGTGSSTYDGNITGDLTHQLLMTGTGTLRLTGDNTGFDGGLDIQSGTVSGTTQSLPDDISNASALIFDQSSSGSFVGLIDGVGSVTKTGSGTVTFTGAQSYTGATQVNGGRLNVNGALPTSAASVGSAGTLGGTGTIMSALAVSGTVDPGVDVAVTDTLNAGAGVSFDQGSTLRVTVLGENDADVLAAGGAVTIDSSALVDPIFAGLTEETSATVLTGSMVTGEFREPGLAFVKITQNIVGGTDLRLTIEPGGPAADSAITDNQFQVANALDTTAAVPPLSEAIADLKGTRLTDAQAREIFDEMSPEVVGGFTNARLAVARRSNDQVQVRIRDMWWQAAEPFWNADGSAPSFVEESDELPPVAARGPVPVHAEANSGFGTWLDGYGVWGGLEGNSDYADLDYVAGGLTLGVDYRFLENWLVGGAFGWASSNIDLNDRAANGEADTYQGLLYAAYATPLFHVGISGRGAKLDMRTERPIDYPLFSETAVAKFDGKGFGARIEAGANAARVYGFDFQPFAGYDYARVMRDAFDEKGSAYRLHVSAEDLDSHLLEVGLRVRSRHQIDYGTWMFPEVEVGWRYELGDIDRRVNSFFVYDVAQTPMFVQSAKPQRGSFVGAFRWAVTIANTAHAFAGYTIWADSRLIEHQVTGGVRLRW